MNIYQQILDIDPENIDAINSSAICIKNMSSPGQDYF